MKRLLLGVAVLAALSVAAPASASWHQPYGGCNEATLAPHSTGAQECRSHGWTIMRRLAVNPHGVVKGSGLPHCKWEDGGENQPCSWNFHDGHRDGNGRGLAYWIDRNDRAHYVWSSRPTTDRWQWVDQSLADALAEGADHPRRWQRCVTNGVDSPVIRVKCPDGYRLTS